MQSKVIEFERLILNEVGHHMGDRNDQQRYDLSQTRPKMLSRTYLCEMLYFYEESPAVNRRVISAS